MKTTAMLLLTVLLGAGCAASTAPVPDTALGLQKGSVFDAPVPPTIQPNTSAPGERQRGRTGAPGWPPAIPHGTADVLPITATQNLCLDCHGHREATPGAPTPIPASHYVDLRTAPAAGQDRVAGARYVCTACHVESTEAAPLVPNHYRP